MVVGWILVTHDGNGGLRSCDHRHGVSVKNGVKRGVESMVSRFDRNRLLSANSSRSNISVEE